MFYDLLSRPLLTVTVTLPLFSPTMIVVSHPGVS